MALNPQDDVDRSFVTRKEVGRWLTSIQDYVDAAVQRFDEYTKRAKGI